MTRKTISHEASAAAFEETTRKGKVRARGRIAVPAIYSTVPGKHREPPRRFMERLDVMRGEWVKAEPEFQKYDLNTMIRVARSMPDFLRVVVIDNFGRRVELSPEAIIKGDMKAGESLRVAKNGKVLRVKAQRKAPEPAPLHGNGQAQVRMRVNAVKKPTKPRVAQITRAPVAVPMLQPIPVRELVAGELAYKAKEGAQFSAMQAAFARAVTTRH